MYLKSNKIDETWSRKYLTDDEPQKAIFLGPENIQRGKENAKCLLTKIKECIYECGGVLVEKYNNNIN